MGRMLAMHATRGITSEERSANCFFIDEQSHGIFKSTCPHVTM